MIRRKARSPPIVPDGTGPAAATANAADGAPNSLRRDSRDCSHMIKPRENFGGMGDRRNRAIARAFQRSGDGGVTRGLFRCIAGEDACQEAAAERIAGPRG